MDVTDAVQTRIEVREYADEPVDDATKRAVLDAGRLAPSGHNAEHWRFVLLDDPGDIQALADASPSGGWVAGADFAVAVCTDPDYGFNEIDAGRSTSNMQLDAWGRGVVSCIFTVHTEEAREVIGVPDDYDLTAVVGFGYPTFEIDSIAGRKDRRPLSELVYHGQFGDPLAIEE